MPPIKWVPVLMALVFGAVLSSVGLALSINKNVALAALGSVTKLEGKLRAIGVTSDLRNGSAPQCACTRPGTKVFNLGFPKAGSSSLDALMLEMGCASVHYWTKNRQLVNRTKLKDANFESAGGFCR